MKNKFTILFKDGDGNKIEIHELLDFIRTHGVKHTYHAAIRDGVLELNGVHVATLEERSEFLDKHKDDIYLGDRVWKIKTSKDDIFGIPVFASESRENLPYDSCVELSLCKGSEDYKKAESVGLIK